MTLRSRGRARRDEGGIATLWSVIVAIACFAIIGLVLDGGVILRARSDAFSLAGAAARVGAQELEPDAAAQGQVVLDPVRARAAAQYERRGRWLLPREGAGQRSALAPRPHRSNK